ncbi:chromosome segregation protein SMC [bacterium]|nr:chromosome segregation protein SMC [bacterium]MBT6777044.1 chromosome segregation protein SMC [bacterium]
MYISELKMHGFKSFAKKEVLKLSQGVTTVVGPNGCGKTNIVDAIRWVLGEQKSSVLRGGKMEDVIFNGAENMKPLSVCDVTLTVHNNKGKLPIEYNDIEIGRRVYRNGESEYTINKTPCRLKDINDLFIDTGMGSDAYSVIELKMIEQILSENGDDRRRMFEEASGINKYRKQRKSTLRKFDATRFDLERINDVISEVEQKVHGLELQLKRFKRHENLTHQLREKDIELAFLKVDKYQNIMSPLEQEIKDYNYLKSSKTDKSSKYEEVLEKNRLVYKEQEDELNALQAKLLTLTENRQEVRQNILIWTEKGNSTSLSIERGKTDYKTNDQRLGILSGEVDSSIEQSEKLQNDLDLALSSYKNKKEELDKIEKKYHEELKYLDQVQNERWNHQKTIASNKSMYDRTKNLINDKTFNASIFSKKILELKKESKQISSTIKSIEKKQLKLDKNYLEEKKDLTEIQNKLQTFIDQQQEHIKKNNSLSVKIESLNDQARFYEELIESNEGFPEGTQYILENPKVFPGVLGTVADMFQVEEKYRDALENGLGELSHCLITKDKRTGLSTLEKALEDNAGDLTIIPLKEAIAYKVKLKSLPKSDNVIALASQLVKTDKKLSPLADYILGDLIVVSDLKDAANDKKLDGWRLVDLNGTYSGKNLVIKSRQVSEHGNLIGRRNKLEIISKQLAHSKNKEKKTITNQALIEKKIDLSRIELNKKQESIKNSESQLSQLDSSLMKNHLNQTQILESLGNLKNELAETEKVLNDSQLSLKKIEPGIQKAEILLSSFQEKINKANQNVLNQGKSRDSQQQILQDARIEMVNIESKNDNIVYKSNSAKEQIKTIEKTQSKIVEEEKKMILLKKEYSQNIENGEKKLTETNAELQKQKSIIDLKQSVFRETYDSIDKIQTKIKLEQKDRESILENLKLSEFKLNELKQKIEIVREQIKERYDTSIPKKLIVDHVEDELSYQVDKIQRSLDNIGPVNMAVQDEYNEDSERLSHLRKQRDDLVESEENLRETIQKIDRIARKKFQETFKLISKNYEKLFNLFFEGGYGALRLVGDPDPLEADIVIDAQPPGKKNTSLRLLSSGEKALTAISLLFSIYQVKPSPYCILDEVDAPLDDINIHKFTKVLKQFADETQFIVVTHNKLTMEIANHMYGVTQEKRGVSKLVSVSFD